MKYCLYFHINKSNSVIFYVGIGNKKRPYSKRSRSQFWKNIVNKYDYLVEVVQSDLKLDEAFDLERYYIKLFGRLDTGSGSLVNLTDGGEGSDGYKHSDETKAKIKEHWSKYRGFDLPEDIEEYKREYNKNYTREYRKNEDVKEKCRESSRIYYNNMSESGKEEYSLKKKKYRDNLPDEIKANNKEYHKNYRDNLPDEIKANNKEYHKNYRKNITEEKKEENRRKNRERMRKKRLSDKNNKNEKLL